MRRRVYYYRQALSEGFSLVIALLGLVSLVTGLALIEWADLSPWLLAVIALSVVLLALAVGAYRVYERREDVLAKAEREREQALQRPSQSRIGGVHVLQDVHVSHSGGHGIVLGGHEVGLGGSSWDEHSPLTTVTRAFKDERVDLDGFIFKDCSFEDVTLVFHGKRPFEFVGENAGRRITLVPASPPLALLMHLEQALQDASAGKAQEVPEQAESEGADDSDDETR